MKKGYTAMSARITNLDTTEEALDALEVILDRWPTNVHQGNTMTRWQECIEWKERLIDNPDQDLGSVKKFLGKCVQGDQESAGRFPIGVDR